MIPDLRDEELVWDKTSHPAYGGSHYGLRPFDQAKIDALEYLVHDTEDITLNKDLVKKHENPFFSGEAILSSIFPRFLYALTYSSAIVLLIVFAISKYRRHKHYEQIIP
jgi:hypothetical protein